MGGLGAANIKLTLGHNYKQSQSSIKNLRDTLAGVA